VECSLVVYASPESFYENTLAIIMVQAGIRKKPDSERLDPARPAPG